MAATFKDYYSVLGISKIATADDVRKAFRKLARKHHPDVNPGNKAAEDTFKNINEAYEVLSDPEKRKLYDRLGPNWKAGDKPSPPESDLNDVRYYSHSEDGAQDDAGEFSDFFETLFRNRAGRDGAAFRRRGRDIEAEISLTLQEAHHGGTRTLNLERTESPGSARRPQALEVNIPAGVRDGSVIRLAGQGGPGANGGSAGDLLLQVRLETHPLFTMVGDDDVRIELPVAPWEAALGAKVNVPTLDGSVEMTIPAGTQGGRQLRLRKQGLTKRGGGRGDEYVKLNIVNPPKLNAKAKELLEKLAAEARFDPREALPGGQS